MASLLGFETPRTGRFLFFRSAQWTAAALLISSWLTSSHFLPWVSWHSEVWVFLGTLLLAWSAIWHVSSTPQRQIRLAFASLPFLALFVVVACQRIAGLLIFDGDVWVLFFYCVLCIICVSLGRAAASEATESGTPASSDVFSLLAWTLSLGALASSVIGFVQVLGVWDGAAWIVRMPELRRAGANLAQANHLATLQVMGVASLLYLRSAKRIGAAAFALLMFTLCTGVASTESRTGALSMLAVFGWSILKRRSTDGPIVALGWGLAFGVLFLLWPWLLNSLGLLEQHADSRLVEGSLRFYVWPQLLKAMTMRPWGGWGFHQVAAAHNAILSQNFSLSQAFAYSHNLLLDLAMWLGVPIGLLTVVAAVLYVVRCARSASQLLPWYGLAVNLPLAVHSMLEYPFAYAYFLAPAMLLLGAVEAAAVPKAFISVRIGAAALVLASVTLAMGWSAVEYLRIEDDFRLARLESAHIARPGEHERLRVRMFDQLGVLLADARISPESNMSADAMQVVKNAALYYPWRATQFRYAASLALNGDPAGAARQMNVIRSIWGDKEYIGVRDRINALSASEHPLVPQLQSQSEKTRNERFAPGRAPRRDR